MARSTPTDRPVAARTTMQKAALVVGIVFLVVGVAGFIPGVTQNFGDITFAGHESEALLLGLFQVSILHNIVHLLFGVWGVAAARTFRGSYTYLLYGGIIYLVLWLYGLVTSDNSAANFVPLNGADDWLHLVLGLGMVGLAMALRRERTTAHV